MSRTVVRSYRRAWHIEKRLYKIPRGPGKPPARIPWPGGVPLLGLAYWFVVLVTIFVLSSLPVTGWILGLLSWPLRYGAVPAMVAALLARPMEDGRAGHRVLVSLVLSELVRWRRRNRWAPIEWSARLPMRWDVTAPVLRRGRLRGPVRVMFRVPVAFGEDAKTRHVRSGLGTGVVVLGPGETMEVDE